MAIFAALFLSDLEILLGERSKEATTQVPRANNSHQEMQRDLLVTYLKVSLLILVAMEPSTRMDVDCRHISAFSASRRHNAEPKLGLWP